MSNILLKKLGKLQLSTKFICALGIVLIATTVVDIWYNANKETQITQKAVRDWTYLFAENIRISLNTLMREDKMDLRFSLFKSMKDELHGLKEIRIIRGNKTDELFQLVNEQDVIPQLQREKIRMQTKLLDLENQFASASDEDKKEELSEQIDEVKEEIETINNEVVDIRQYTPINEIEQVKDGLDQQVLDTGQALYQFTQDDARVVIPYQIQDKGCADEDGCHKYGKEGDVLGAISLKFSIQEINEQIRSNNIEMVWIWVARLILYLGIIALLLSIIITKNLHHMMKIFHKISEGNLTVRAPVKTEDEIGNLAISFNKMASSLEETKKELDQRLLEIYALYNVSKTLNASYETEQLLLGLVKDISKNMKVNRMMIMLVDEETGDLKVASHTGFNDEKVAILQGHLGEGFYGSVASSGQCALVEDVDADKNIKKMEIAGKKINSVIAVPFHRRDKVLGLICAYKDRPDKFKPTDLNLFESVAEHLAVALENTRMFEQTKHMAITDGLTGLYNKRFFLDTIKSEIERSKRYDENLSFFMMDIDNFKNYNDTNGHQAGDDLLKEMASLIQSSVRKVDIAFRYGGEELVVILTETDKAGAMILAEKLVKTISKHPFMHREKQPLGCISVSMGLATFPEDAKDADDLICRADKALYVAKNSGKNRVEIYTDSIR